MINGQPFIFEENPEFEWPVTVRLPSEAGFIERTFTGVFRVMPEDEFFAAYESETASAALSEEVERMMRVFVGWRGIALEDGGDLDVNDENRRRLLGQRLVRLAINRAYQEAVILNGVRAKNSDPLRN